MSDALTDIARGGDLGRLYDEYLRLLKEFLRNPTECNRRAAINAAAEADRVPRGYWGSQSQLVQKVEKELSLLQQGNKNAWAKFLFYKSQYEKNIFDEFKAVSPFANKVVVAVYYGHGFVRLYGDESPVSSEWINLLIRVRKGWKTYDADDFVIVFDKFDAREFECFWVGCGILGIKGPRAAD